MEKVRKSIRERVKQIPGSRSVYRAFSFIYQSCYPMKLEIKNRVEFSQFYGVNSSIHAEDLIYQFVMNAFAFNRQSGIKYYFSSGDESARNLISLKHEVGLIQKVDLLEFASGYGCVTRHLVKYPKEFVITSCDIHKQAIDYIEDTLNVPCTASSNLPEDFRTPKKYGIVFALSFFSHMPQKTWGKWLAALYRSVESGGYLIFTTHGLVTLKQVMKHAVLDENGFWFYADSEQQDLDLAEYGSTITAPNFVRQEIAKLGTAKVSLFYEGYWWGHQDVWVIKNTSLL